jgi:hypothetical protein
MDRIICFANVARRQTSCRERCYFL